MFEDSFEGSTFVRILAPHAESDVTVVCRGTAIGRSSVVPIQEVRFFCHRAILQRRCGLFRALHQFENTAWAYCEPATKRRRTHQELDADDDVVFEVLRYAYCGTVHLGLAFHTRLLQFLAVVDYLGVDTMVLFGEPAVARWLCELPISEIWGVVREIGSATKTSNHRWELGFHTRRSVLSTLVQLRPGEVTLDALNVVTRNPQMLDSLPGLVNLRIVSMAGEGLAELKMDWHTRIDTVISKLYEVVGSADVVLELVLAGEVLAGALSLKDVGANGAGSLMVLNLVERHAETQRCFCGKPVARHVCGKFGPDQGKCFLTCSSPAGFQCNFFEWVDHSPH